jgi:hypothetical protein
MDWFNRLPLRLQCYITCKLNGIKLLGNFDLYDRNEII